ncbi:MAG TPA: tetratricopeptide repeat protein [Chitinophagaceae bacterium]|nr:tetratricopeptide repeat protein [Chitinophagaceae bacterium]
MKITAVIFLSVFTYGAGNTQNMYADSIRSELAITATPEKRFDLLNRIVDDIFTKGTENIDYSLCVEMVRIAQQLKSDSLLAIAYNTVGNYFLLNNGDYSNALEYFFKGIPLSEKAKDKRRLSSLYVDIAVVYYRLNNPDEQIKYLRKAMANLPPTTSPFYHFMLTQVQAYTCRYFILKNNYDSAMHYVLALNESNRYLKSPVYNCAAQGLLGLIYEKKGDTVLAELHYEIAVAGADSVRYFYIKHSIKTPYIDFLIRLHKIPEALNHTRQLMTMGEEKNNPDVKRTAAGFLRRIAELTRQTDSAYYYSMLESSFKDSVFNQNNFNKIQSLAFSEQLRVMEEEAKIAMEEEKRRHNIQYALLAMGIITFIILFLVLSHSFTIDERLIRFLIVIALLIVFEFLNLLLHPFLEKITYHNPVFMLLALVCIAALLVPLHHRLEKWAVHKLLEKNRRIRLGAEKKMATI